MVDPRKQTALPHARTDEDLNEALDFTESLGFIRIRATKPEFTCPLYESILSKSVWQRLGSSVQWGTVTTKSGYVNVVELCKEFGRMGRRAVARLLDGSGDWRDRDGVAECTIQVLFHFFVAGTIPAFASVVPEAVSGRGRNNVLVICQPPRARVQQRAAIEIKFWRRSTKGSPLAIRRAAYQVAFDGFRLSATERHVLIIDAQDKFWTGRIHGDASVITTSSAEGLRLGLRVKLPELRDPVAVTVHGFAWAGGDHSASGSARLHASASTVVSEEAAAAAAAAATGVDVDNVEETVVETAAVAAIDRERKLARGAMSAPVASADAVCVVSTLRERPSSKPPSPSREGSPSSSPLHVGAAAAVPLVGAGNKRARDDDDDGAAVVGEAAAKEARQ
jgi:hypothetical protein